jgi:hypothetical protein
MRMTGTMHWYPRAFQLETNWEIAGLVVNILELSLLNNNNLLQMISFNKKQVF